MGMTRRLQRRERIAYNAARRTYPGSKMPKWCEWVAACRHRMWARPTRESWAVNERMRAPRGVGVSRRRWSRVLKGCGWTPGRRDRCE